MRPSRILVPTDFSTCSRSALERGLSLARQTGASLYLFHAVLLYAGDPQEDFDEGLDLEKLYQGLEVRAASRLAAELASQNLEGVQVHSLVRRAHSEPAAVARIARSEQIDLIVMGTHGRRGVRRFLLGSVTEELLRTAPCPVLAVHYDEHADSGAPLSRVVVGHDFSDQADHALEFAIGLIGDSNIQLDLVHVLPPPLTPGLSAPVPIPYTREVLAGLTDRLEKLLADRAGDLTSAKALVLQGYPAGQIIDHAGVRGADLIVVGSRGLTGLSRFLLGSVAERVVRISALPVLVVPDPPDVSEPSVLPGPSDQSGEHSEASDE